jgi:hypothetical protein
VALSVSAFFFPLLWTSAAHDDCTALHAAEANRMLLRLDQARDGGVHFQSG